MRPGAGGLPPFPGAAATVHWSTPDPAATGGSDEATYPAFAQCADDLEGRVALLLADLSTNQREGTDHA